MTQITDGLFITFTSHLLDECDGRMYSTRDHAESIKGTTAGNLPAHYRNCK